MGDVGQKRIFTKFLTLSSRAKISNLLLCTYLFSRQNGAPHPENLSSGENF